MTSRRELILGLLLAGAALADAPARAAAKRTITVHRSPT
jgi:hypothetical protein